MFISPSGNDKCTKELVAIEIDYRELPEDAKDLAGCNVDAERQTPSPCYYPA
jgi:hypothetical protein